MDDRSADPGIDATAVRRRLDIEIGEVRAAILLVASGTSSHVRLVGLAFGTELLVRMRADAARAGVDLRPEFRPEDTGCDISVVARDA
jgi:hypothetical protein